MAGTFQTGLVHLQKTIILGINLLHQNQSSPPFCLITLKMVKAMNTY